MIRYGTNPIAWSNDDDRTLGGHISLTRCLDDAARIGFDGIEKGHKLPTTPEGVAAELGARGLAYVAGWHSLNLLRQSVGWEKTAMQPFLDLLKAVGAKVIIVCETSNSVHGNVAVPASARPVLGKDDWPVFAAGVEALGAFAAAQGITLAYHPHAGTVIETPDEIDRLMKLTGPATKLLFDTGHCVFGGGDPTTVLTRHAGRVAHVHAKNVRPDVLAAVRAEDLSFLEGVRRGVFTVPGDAGGMVDFLPCLRLLADAGYRGWLIIEAEQDPDQHDPFRHQALGLRTLKAMARDAGLDRA